MSIPLKRKVLLWRDAEARAAEARKRAAQARTGQVVRSTIDVGDNTVPMDEALVGGVEAGELSELQQEALDLLDQDQADNLDIYLEGPSLDIDDQIDASELVNETIQEGTDRWEEIADAGEVAHEAAMDAIGVNRAVDEAQEAAEQAAVDASYATETALGNARYRQIDGGEIVPTLPDDGVRVGAELVRVRENGKPYEANVWDGGAWVHAQYLADELIVPSDEGAIRLADGIVSAPNLSTDALDAKVIRNGQFFGGYIEAPTIASSSRLGTGANKLADPAFESQIDTAWIASGHLGDAAVLQRDTITWDQSWTMPNASGVTVTTRNRGSVVAELRSRTFVRKTGTAVMPNYAWMRQTSRGFNNPYKFVNQSALTFTYGSGGRFDPSFAEVTEPARNADVSRTTYLTNSSVVMVAAGERWNIRLEYTVPGQYSRSFLAAASVEIVRADTLAVLVSVPISSAQLSAGSLNAWWNASYTGEVRYRVRATYTAAGTGLNRTTTSASWSRRTRSGVQDAEWVGTSALVGLGYGGYPASYTDSIPTAYAQRATLEWEIKTAVFAQVEPTAGWRLTEDDGLELFNSLGARTARLNGAENYFSGRLATAESGERLEVFGTAITVYDALGNVLSSIVHQGDRFAFGSQAAFPGDTVGNVMLPSSIGAPVTVVRKGNSIMVKMSAFPITVAANTYLTVAAIGSEYAPAGTLGVGNAYKSGGTSRFGQMRVSGGAVQVIFSEALSNVDAYGSVTYLLP
ncbi:hypothetical protein [Leucobacter luti]|uniref:Uncharacterized protein n=1 Tax=Leucobacter luti TaxID=340320 RepID=A0A4Q7U1H4_9MICO|nr:hypothetical protein [Leucobacter luti]MBL3699226.1 hypothetical protein [Leucobacter luti]RZT66727.1 hypothetical protein EV139_0854 [Leucobacter luti]